jgi:glucose/arabinose dehydrogenase
MPSARRRHLASCLVLVLGLTAACTAPATPSPTGAASPGAASSPGASQPGSTVPPLDSGPDRLRLELVAEDLNHPIGLTSAGDGSGRMFVNERDGAVRVIGPDGALQDRPFVDLSDRIDAGGERGLLGLAFHPDFATNRRLFVHYSRAGDGSTVVSELTASADLQTADPGSERVLFSVPDPFVNHNGGQLAFGPDGYLYIGLGDGGGGGDPLQNGQNTDVLLGKILRIDVDAQDGGRGYAIPANNPFGPGGANPGGGRPEIWAVGLRNPWRFSFDPDGGDLYIGDVGQGSWEEIDRQPADSAGGENYGWSVMEGRHCFGGDCDQTGFVKPIAEYSHDLGCSVSGGYVYRGTAQPELQGVYVFGDYCSGTIFTLQVDEGTIDPKRVLDSGLSISSFGTDEDGEIYVVDISGAVYHVLVDG